MNKGQKTDLPYSAFRTAGDLIYISGQLPIDPTSGDIIGDIRTQTQNSLHNLDVILKSIGLSKNSIVKTTVFMTDMGEFMQMNEIYKEFFSAPYPARSAFGVKELPKGAKVEIEAIAYKG